LDDPECRAFADAGLKSFAWLDGAQALIATVLAYLQLFSVLPSHAHPEAISATNLTNLNNAENLILVGAVTLRFFSNPSPARRRFYHVLAVYLWVNGIVVLILGHLELKPLWSFRVQDAGWDTPYLALMGSFAFQQKIRMDKSERSNGQRTAGLLIDNLSPVLFTLAITLMGVKIAPRASMVGICLHFGGGGDLWSTSSDIAGELCQVASGADQGDDCSRTGESRQEPIPGEHEP
jgi:hypothetical protein